MYRYRWQRFIIIIFSILLFSSCASFSRFGARPSLLSADTYLQLAANSSGIKKQQYLILAATRLVQDRKPDQAQKVLYQLNVSMLTPTLTNEQQLLQAQIFILQHRYQRSLAILNTLANNKAVLTREQTIAYHQLRAKIFSAQGKVINSINERMQLLNLLSSSDAKQKVIQQTWRSLQNLSPTTIKNLLAQTPAPLLRGWLDLALISKQPFTNMQQLQQDLSTWRSNYPNHPANTLLPPSLRSGTAMKKPLHIALLLPLQGRYAGASKAIRNGFLAAYYQYKIRNRGQAMPDVNVINTANQNIQTVYQNAIQNGADFIVGPLTKNNVAQLASNRSLPAPTLALNSLPDNARGRTTNLMQFGLSPTDAIAQITNKAYQDNHLRALIIAPNNNWGQNLVTLLNNNWQQLGGQAVGILRFGKQSQLSTEVSQLLHTQQSRKRYHHMRWLLKRKIRYISRRRKDFDVIFLIAHPLMARQIVPLLKFYYTGDIPVYAIPDIYHGFPDPRRDHDLNGVIFCDMPWVLEPSTMQPSYLLSIRQSINSSWSHSFYRYPKLYALGVDAFDVIHKLNKMALLPQFGTNAASGTLYLDPNKHLYRKLMWAQFSHGTPHLLAE
jgi:uncharacterized protein